MNPPALHYVYAFNQHESTWNLFVVLHLEPLLFSFPNRLLIFIRGAQCVGFTAAPYSR